MIFKVRDKTYYELFTVGGLYLKTSLPYKYRVKDIAEITFRLSKVKWLFVQ